MLLFWQTDADYHDYITMIENNLHMIFVWKVTLIKHIKRIVLFNKCI